MTPSRWPRLPMPSAAPLRRAFTLVELLVVIAIIMLLVALLMPSLRKATALARDTICRTNQRSLQHAYFAYGKDSRGRLLPYVARENSAGNYYLPFENFWMEILTKYHGDVGDVRQCPETRKLKSNGWGSTFTCWGPTSGGFIRHHWGSYAINGWMYDMGWDGVHHVGVDHMDYETIHVKHPSDVPVFCDSAWVDAWPRETHDPPASYDEMLVSHNRNSMGRVCIARHGMTINLAFADASARSIHLDELWRIYWYKGMPKAHMPVPRPWE